MFNPGPSLIGYFLEALPLTIASAWPVRENDWPLPSRQPFFRFSPLIGDQKWDSVSGKEALEVCSANVRP